MSVRERVGVKSDEGMKGERQDGGNDRREGLIFMGTQWKALQREREKFL